MSSTIDDRFAPGRLSAHAESHTSVHSCHDAEAPRQGLVNPRHSVLLLPQTHPANVLTLSAPFDDLSHNIAKGSRKILLAPRRIKGVTPAAAAALALVLLTFWPVPEEFYFFFDPMEPFWCWLALWCWAPRGNFTVLSGCQCRRGTRWVGLFISLIRWSFHPL